jgi:hypothetical protein
LKLARSAGSAEATNRLHDQDGLPILTRPGMTMDWYQIVDPTAIPIGTE